MRILISAIIAVMALSLPAWAGDVVGWRTDGTGKYPQATPPTVWAKDKNVAWATKLPAFSNATPVVAGDRIFTCVEPATLVCVSAKDGSILWQKGNDYADVMGDDYAKKVEQAVKFRGPVDRGNYKLAVIQQQIAQNEDAAKKATTRAASQPAAQKHVDELMARRADLNAQLETAKKALAAAEAQYKPFAAFSRPDVHPVNGYSSQTPVTDGRYVCVVFGTGIAACYDMQGNRQWAKLLEQGPGGWGISTSPTMHDGKFIVQVKKLFCLDAKTGKEIWSAAPSFHWGSIVKTKIGDTDVIVMPGGEIIRVADGKIICTLQPMEYCAPVVDQGVVYCSSDHAFAAFALPKKSADKLEIKPLWTTQVMGARHYASPVVADGLAYNLNDGGVLEVMDVKDGKLAYSEKLGFKGGTCYPSLALAGKYLYASSDNGVTIVFEPGRKYKEVARNTLETFRSCPVFIGGRMYVRAEKNLYCIEITANFTRND